jgi:hypothetical protein
MNPCLGCAGDHAAGVHAHGSHDTTCRKCRAPHTRDTTGMTDVPALAANDTELIEDRNDNGMEA